MFVVDAMVRKWFIVGGCPDWGYPSKEREFSRPVDAYKKAAQMLIARERCDKCEVFEVGVDPFSMKDSNWASESGLSTWFACGGKPMCCPDCPYGPGRHSRRLVMRVARLMQRSDKREEALGRTGAKP